MAGVTAIVIIIYLFVIFLSLAIEVGTYVFESLGLYRIAERRIGNEVLAWVPFARKWLLGKIADQYEEASHNKKTHYQTILLWLSIAPVAIYALIIVVYISMFISLGGNHNFQMADGTAAAFVISVMVVLFLAATLAQTVVYFLALYRLYKSCDEKNTVVYLVLSILIGITRPIFIFICGKKDSPLMQDYLNQTRKVNPMFSQTEQY